MKRDTQLTILAVGVLAVAYIFLRKKKQDVFVNASGCSMSDLSELMDVCEGGAMEGETTSIRSCKVKRNGTRVGKCRYDSDGGVRFSDVTIGGRQRLRRDVTSSFSNVGGARQFCRENNNMGLSGSECRKIARASLN